MSSSDHAATPLGVIDFRTDPAHYHHWQLEIDGHVAWLGLAVNEQATIGSGYELKLNSYDLGVDIELHDAGRLTCKRRGYCGTHWRFFTECMATRGTHTTSR